jgi:UDP-2,3-diacylglucosamine pyrophosphatase LpxH
MRLAFISDTHFGDEMCTLVDHDTLEKGQKFEDFAGAAGTQNDFLVLLGDIFDLSIASYEDAYRHAKAFFQLIKRHRIAKNIIYVPGNHDFDMWNHDFDMWHTVQQQIRIIYQVGQGKPALAFRWSVPGLIDDRGGTRSRGFRLPGIIGPVDSNRRPRSEKMFLNGITKNPRGGGSETNFYVAYPNLYMVTDDQSLVFTHGHYLEAFWSLSGEWIRKVARIRNANSVEDLVALNVPLCQLACSGVGQAGKLTSVFLKLRREVNAGNFERIEKYLDRLEECMDDLTEARFVDPKTWIQEAFTDVVARRAKKVLVESLERRVDTRYSTKFVTDQEVLNRFKHYYRATWTEIGELNKAYQFNIRQPQGVIFGHTHRPIGWLDRNAPRASVVNRKSVRLYNTGGWLWRKDKRGRKQFCGAEVFRYDSSSGFDSVSVR